MKKDKTDTLFNIIKSDFDMLEVPSGHQQRFLDKLQNNKVRKSASWKTVLRIAALFVVIITSVFFVSQMKVRKTGLAAVSPKLAQTESFFITTINKELKSLKEQENQETKKIIEDALLQIKQLESDYAKLKKDLARNNNNKRIVFAMITNLQNRINFLEEVLEKLSEIKKINKNTYETL